MTITSIEQFISTHLADASDYAKTEARILNSFLIRLVEAGYELVSVYDGGETIKIEGNNRFETLFNIFSVESSSLLIRSPNICHIRLYLLTGEGEAQTIYDHSEITDEEEDFIFKLWAKCVKTHDATLYADYWQ